LSEVATAKSLPRIAASPIERTFGSVTSPPQPKHHEDTPARDLPYGLKNANKRVIGVRKIHKDSKALTGKHRFKAPGTPGIDAIPAIIAEAGKLSRWQCRLLRRCYRDSVSPEARRLDLKLARRRFKNRFCATAHRVVSRRSNVSGSVHSIKMTRDGAMAFNSSNWGSSA
jgi:hypothetical protein